MAVVLAVAAAGVYAPLCRVVSVWSPFAGHLWLQRLLPPVFGQMTASSTTFHHLASGCVCSQMCPAPACASAWVSRSPAETRGHVAVTNGTAVYTVIHYTCVAGTTVH